jgi:mannan endo-1,4-beta-mannosidase
MKTHLLFASFVLLSSTVASAQPLNVAVTINTNDRKPISPLIYGINAYVFDTEWQTPQDWKVGLDNVAPNLNITCRRLGGNTMTSYNWENGYCNSGNDDNHSNNTFQSFITGAGEAPYTPGAALTTFHGHSMQLGAYSLLQLPAAGYVAADGNGPVSQAETAPSVRWKKVVFNKAGTPGSLSLNPDLNDDKVCVDEEMNFLINRYGNASTATGIKAYELDNEPGLWHHYPNNGDQGTHPRLYGARVLCVDLLQRDIALATTIKRMDPNADVYGPAMWGYPEYYSLWSIYADGATHQPIDWDEYNVEPYLTNNTGDRYRYNGMTWVNAYLAKMKAASDNAGRRLLDVFSFHYYPADEAVANDAMLVQAPRSLWDPTFVEQSWITKAGNGFTDGRALQLIPKMQQSIDDFYPGTKLGITEYSFGGRHSVAGGIAEADALGIFGRYGVHEANYFFPVDDYIAAGIRIYRNYDGANSTFGDTAVATTTSDIQNSSVYSSLDNKGNLHIIFINKAAQVINAQMTINGKSYSGSDVWVLDGSGSQIRRAGSASMNGNVLSYAAPQMSVSHVVLRATSAVPQAPEAPDLRLSISPNPFSSRCSAAYDVKSGKGKIEIVDLLGNVVRQVSASGSGAFEWDGTDASGVRCASGIYTIVLESPEGIVRQKVMLAR